jgi:integrase
VTFAEYATDWIATYTGRTSRGVGPETRADYRRALGLDDQGEPTGDGAVAFLGRKRLAEIEPRDLRQYATHVAAKGVKRDTVRLALAPVKALLATAAEDGLIRANPAHGLRNLLPAHLAREGEEPIKALTEDELQRLLAELPPQWRPFFDFLSQTGLRIGEAIEVRAGDIDFGKRRLHVQRRYYRGRVDLPKGRKRRRVPLSEELARDLWVRVNETHVTDDDLLFTAEKGGRIDQSNLMSRVLKASARDAGIGDWLGFHAFRHTCATMLFRRGWNAVQVQRFLGHSDPGFTLRRYVHLLDDDLPEPRFAIEIQRGDSDLVGRPFLKEAVN